MQQQCQVLTLASRAFYTDALGEYAEYLTKLFGYQRMMPMNTGQNESDSYEKHWKTSPISLQVLRPMIQP
jgi:ornithine--oxo-acid transaminase